MSRRSTLFLVYNLASEMVYVLAQRLNSQNVPTKQAAAAIDKIIGMLSDWDLLTILITPGEMFSHEKVKNIIEDIAQCSQMRLDSISMDKLWDLITMILKWQINLCDSSNQILNLTETHLNEIEKYVSNVDTLDKLNRIQSCLSMLKEGLNTNELKMLHYDLTNWLKDFNVKVSLLIKLELQSPDGKFIKSPTNEVNKYILSNLGKNIYLSEENDRLALSIKEKKEKEINGLKNDLLGSVNSGGFMQLNDCKVKSDDFKVKINDFKVKASDFEVKASDLQMKASEFQVKPSDFLVKTNDFEVKTNDFKVKTNDFKVKTNDFKVKTNDFKVKTNFQVKPKDFQFIPLNRKENNNSDFDKIDVKRDESNLKEIFDDFHVNERLNDNNDYDFINIVTSN